MTASNEPDGITQVAYTFAVITSVPDPGKGVGNEAVVLDVRVDAQAFGESPGSPSHPITELGLPPMAALYLRAPVFTLGEIVILDGEYGREVAGQQRKPHKWSVAVECFDDVVAAVERAREIELGTVRS